MRQLTTKIELFRRRISTKIMKNRVYNNGTYKKGAVILLQNRAARREIMEQTVEERLAATSKFMSNMSHDIRTPLNAVIGYASLLEQASHEPEKVMDYAHKICLAGSTLLALINDVLDMSRIESGKVKLAHNDFDVVRVIEEVVAAIKPQSEGKNQQFITCLHICAAESPIGVCPSPCREDCTSTRLNFDGDGADSKLMLKGDSDKLCRVLINLLSNAVKYTPEGGIVRFCTNATTSGKVNFVIRDNGIGMAEEFIGKVFEPFAREDTIRRSGTGLGMSIAKEIVDLMGGYINLESRTGKGTTVTVCLEMEPAVEDIFSMAAIHGLNDLCIADIEVNSQPEPLAAMNFLVAEDNELNAEIINEMLAMKGATCVIEHNGRDAVDRFIHSEPSEFDAVLMDVQMPVMDGYTAARAIREYERFKSKDTGVLIIALTADAFEHDIQKAFESGMNAHISKPVDMDALTTLLHTLKRGDTCR